MPVLFKFPKGYTILVDASTSNFLANQPLELDPKIENKVLAERFCVTEKTVSQWVSDIRARFYASRSAIIYRLQLLGWTQQEIGNMFDLV